MIRNRGDGSIDQGNPGAAAAPLREVKAPMRPLFSQKRVAALASSFLGRATTGENPSGCALRRLATPGHGGVRRSWVAGGGLWIPCATSCATMP